VHSRVADWLDSAESRIEEIRAGSDEIAIYGAGLLGSLLKSVLGPRVRVFIDDNPQHQGKQLLGCTISSLDTLRNWKGRVVIAVPPTATERVFEKCRSRGLRADRIFFQRDGAHA
jgi:prephenate dehydrogenase